MWGYLDVNNLFVCLFPTLQVGVILSSVAFFLLPRFFRPSIGGGGTPCQVFQKGEEGSDAARRSCSSQSKEVVVGRGSSGSSSNSRSSTVVVVAAAAAAAVVVVVVVVEFGL